MTADVAPRYEVFRRAGDDTVRLVMSPSDVVRLAESISPAALRAFALLYERSDLVPFAGDGFDAHALDILTSGGVPERDAREQLDELFAASVLPRSLRVATTKTPMCSEVSDEPVLLLPPPRFKRRGRCTVCSGSLGSWTDLDTTYVVRRGAFVKVGATRDLQARIRVLSQRAPGVWVPSRFNINSRLILLATSKVPEHDVHEWLAPWHEGGEWFTHSAEMVQRLSELLADAA